ncbi:MAG TPA: hypothetical protein VF469_33855, partial [Kofleriaceae bacterium]
PRVIEILNTFSAWGERDPLHPTGRRAGARGALSCGTCLLADPARFMVHDFAACADAVTPPARQPVTATSASRTAFCAQMLTPPAASSGGERGGQVIAEVIAICQARRAFRALIARAATC